MVRIVDPYRSAPLFTIYDVFREWKKRKMWQNAIVIFQQHCSTYSCSTSVNPIDCFWPPKVYSSICLLHMSFIADICYLVLSTYLSNCIRIDFKLVLTQIQLTCFTRLHINASFNVCCTKNSKKNMSNVVSGLYQKSVLNSSGGISGF